MEGIVVSLNENILKVSINDYQGLRGGSSELDSNIANGSLIVDQDGFVDALKGLIDELADNKTKKLPLNFLVEPQDIILRFITIPKNEENLTQKIIDEVRDKMEGVAIEDTYFSYSKIAPFVYQFIAIEKSKLEQYLTVATMSGYELRSVVPWLSLLPKFLKDNDPSIFVTKSEGKQVIALSELNGIYFVGVYDKGKSTNDIQKLVTELSVYKRKSPITRIFTINYEDFDLEEGYQIMPLSIPIEGLTQDDAYSLHTLYGFVIDKITGFLNTQNNLLNLLPLPAPVKNKSLMYVGAVTAAIILALAGFGGYRYLSGNSSTTTETNPEVLSDSGESSEATPSELQDNSESDSNEAEVEVEEVDEIVKEDLSIRVENGAGISGIAASTQATLEELGYTVTDIGNAEGDLRENTLVKFKTSKLAYRDTLIEDIKEEFEIVLEDGLDEDSDHDVLIIVGQN